MTVQSHNFNSAELYNLLNHGFDGWGTKEYFEWKYNLYPDYDPEMDNFVIYCDSDLVAARRIFRRELVAPNGERHTAHIHGGTVVHKDYRGKGYYSKLLDRSMSFSNSNAEYVFTCNRDGKITTKHHQKDGWNQLILPLYIKVLSPSKVINEYMLNSDIFDYASDHLSTFERRIMSVDAVSEIASKCTRMLYNNRESIGPTMTLSNSSYDINIFQGKELKGKIIHKIYNLLGNNALPYYHFNRSPETIRHCISYPESRIFIAQDKETDGLLSFAITGILDKKGIRECRVLDHAWKDSKTAQQIYKKIEEVALNHDVDVIITCSKYRPNLGWSALATDYLMWPDDNPSLPTSANQWRITTYDIL